MTIFEQIDKMFDRGILSNKFHYLEPLQFGHKSGLYAGCPGVDIYNYLNASFNDDELNRLIQRTASFFPETRSGRPTNLTCFLRNIYNMEQKNGVLLHDVRKKELIALHPDWKISHIFIDRLIERLVNTKKYYGIIIAKEMKAHRLGDEAIIYNNVNILKETILIYSYCYEESIKMSVVKNECSSSYWAARYLLEFGFNKWSLMWGWRFINAYLKYDLPRPYNRKIIYLYDNYMRKLVNKRKLIFIDKFFELRNTKMSGLEFEKFGLINPFK